MSKYINADDVNALIMANTEALLRAIDKIPEAKVIEEKALTDSFLEAYYRKFAEAIERKICGEVGERKEAK